VMGSVTSSAGFVLAVRSKTNLTLEVARLLGDLYLGDEFRPPLRERQVQVLVIPAKPSAPQVARAGGFRG
jgi:hypothetical protein